MSEVAAALERATPAESRELDRAFAEAYPELKNIARSRLRSSGLQGQMQTTALVHEGYVKLAEGRGLTFPSRLHFLAYASRALRSIVIDTVREQRAQRRGGDVDLVTLDTAAGDVIAGSADVEAVHRALDDLARLDAGLARLVEMRFFGGLTAAEIAEALGVSESSVDREWKKARVLLYTMLAG